MNGAELITKERKRQIKVEGWTAEHDDNKNNAGDLLEAGKTYANYAWWQIKAGVDDITVKTAEIMALKRWPWELKYWKPTKKPIRNLVKAGALIAAEIDRLQRLKDK